MDNAITTIKAAKEYNINHLQLSHQIIHNLMEVKNQTVQSQMSQLTRLTHLEGIEEVLIWDHSFYALDYYPVQFKTGPHGTINLDNLSFWSWFKQDYRRCWSDFIKRPNVVGYVVRTDRYGTTKLVNTANLLLSIMNLITVVMTDMFPDVPLSVCKSRKADLISFGKNRYCYG